MDKLIKLTKELSVPELEKELLRYDQADCPVIHHFAPGIYMRELNAKSGMIIIGHHHTTEHLNICLKGRLTLYNKDKPSVDIAAPHTLIAKPGRKVAYVHEDLVWLNLFSTDETDVSKLEKMFFKMSNEFVNAQEIKEDRVVDNSDYIEFLKEFDITEEYVKTISENKNDQISFPMGSYSVVIHESNIQGKGLFATAPFSKGDMIVPARIAGNRTPAGRFANHAQVPNAKMKFIKGDFYLFANRDIEGNKGGIIGEEITVDYREVLKSNLSKRG